MRSLRAILLIALLAATGCREIDPPDITPPCGAEGASRADLGLPLVGRDVSEHFDFEDNYAEFTTAGGDLYVTTYGQHGGGFFDRYPARDSISFGQGAPEWEEGYRTPMNALVTERVFEDHYTVVNLNACRYWVTGANGHLEIVSCEADALSDVRAVPDWPPIEASDLVPPCAERGLSRVELGSPTYERFNRYQDLSQHAKFTTTGGQLYIKVTDVVDSPVKDRYVPYARVQMSRGEPRRNPNIASSLNRPDVVVDVPEGDFVEVTPVRRDQRPTPVLDPGTYWVFTTPAANVTIVSCEEDGVYDARPVAPVGANGSGS